MGNATAWFNPQVACMRAAGQRGFIETIEAILKRKYLPPKRPDPAVGLARSRSSHPIDASSTCPSLPEYLDSMGLPPLPVAFG
jgi:hypothetical protein